MNSSRPYYPISHYYRAKFGGKVYKVSVSVAESCPNRQPNGRLKPCIFCDEWGSAAYHLERERSLADQITINRERIRQRYRANRFLVYFQSYTNTFDRVEQLRSRFETALQQEGVIGLVLGTRPDCLPQRIFPLLREYRDRAYLMVELGVQSFDDHQLNFLQRGHTSLRSVEAIKQLHEQCGVDVGIHLIFGLPGEDDDAVIATAERVNELAVQNVKLHNLHVLKGTPLEVYYRQGNFTPITLEEYAHRVTLFLRHLSPDIAIQRLAAVANRWDELIAPDWTREKMRPTQYIEDLMTARGIFQGDLA